MENNLVIAGCYYFREGRDLIAAIEEQFKRNMTLKNEFFLADAMSIMIEQGTKIRTHEISTWLDTGTIEATLDTNKILLDQLGGNTRKQADWYRSRQVHVIEPSFIDPTAEISNSTIGPHASIGANCKIHNSSIAESIIEPGCEIHDAALKMSLIGKQARVKGRDDGHVIQLNIGDNSDVVL
jgi:glucose-1-phosphate thymidylyltransferase